MNTETITLGAGLLFVFLAIIGGGITGKDTKIPIIRTPGRVALGFIGLVLCLPFVVGRIHWAGAVPKGTIVAWYSKDHKPPPGWAFCDANWDASGPPTPNLHGLFIRGTTNFSDVGKTGGLETHKHYIAGDGQPHPKSGNTVGNIDAEQMISHEATNLPPYMNIVYIIKL